MTEDQQHIVDLIIEERASQDDKWGPQRHMWSQWLAILTEEVGEVAQECLRLEFNHESDLQRLQEELVQVAAVTTHMLEQVAEYRRTGRV